MRKEIIMAVLIAVGFAVYAGDAVRKINETSIEVTKQAEIPAPVKTTYERKFIEEQIVSITKQRDELIALKNKELAECNAILAEMDKLGVKVKNEK